MVTNMRKIVGVKLSFVNSFSNIELINFENLNNDNENFAQELNTYFNMNYLNDFIQHNNDYEHVDIYPENYFLSQQNNISNLTDSPPLRKQNTSCNSSQMNEQITCYSEGMNYQLDVVTPNEKPFVCPFENCEKSFKFKWILERHSNSHKSIKIFVCDHSGCTKAYKSKENLSLHYKNIHLREKPYSCKFCPSLFSHRNGKTYHERKFHTNYLPHVCDHEECEMAFASKSALTYHLKAKHGEKSGKKYNGRSKFIDESKKGK